MVGLKLLKFLKGIKPPIPLESISIDKIIEGTSGKYTVKFSDITAKTPQSPKDYSVNVENYFDIGLIATFTVTHEDNVNGYTAAIGGVRLGHLWGNTFYFDFGMANIAKLLKEVPKEKIQEEAYSSIDIIAKYLKPQLEEIALQYLKLH